MEKLIVQIISYAPQLKQKLSERATEIGKDVFQYLEDSKFNYVLGYVEKKPLEKLLFDWYAYFYKEEAEQDKSEGDVIMTEYDYIILMLETEKEERQSVRKWGYEFSINEDGSVSIRREMGKRITIQVDVANKITLV